MFHMFLTEESLGSNCVYIAMCVYIRHIYVDIAYYIALVGGFM